MSTCREFKFLHNVILTHLNICPCLFSDQYFDDALPPSEYGKPNEYDLQVAGEGILRMQYIHDFDTTQVSLKFQGLTSPSNFSRGGLKLTRKLIQN